MIVQTSFPEFFYTHNVLFSYYGHIDKDILNQALKIINLCLKKNKESLLVSRRLYNTINECVENIIKHNFFPDEGVMDYRSLLLVSKEDNHYLVDTINIVNVRQKESIHQKLDHLTSKNKEDLRNMKLDIISNKQYSEVSTAGLGLLDMILKSDGYQYHFKNYDSDFLFNINFKINSTHYGNT